MIRSPPRSTRTHTLFPYTTLFRSCVASQITSLSFHIDRDRQLAQIVGAAQIDMADKWEPNQVFYDQLSKATLLKLLAEGRGNDAAENCKTMKRSDLAVTVKDRLARRRILPPALRPSALPDAADSASQPACRHGARKSVG